MEEQYHLSSAERAFKDKIIKRMKGYYIKKKKKCLNFVFKTNVDISNLVNRVSYSGIKKLKQLEKQL